MPDYQTIRGISTFEYEEKRSRFIASAAFADTEEVLGTVADAVHPAHPFQLIGSFQGFGHALGFLHLPDSQCKLFLGLFVQLGKIAAQLTGQEQLIVPDRVLRLQVRLM